MSPHSESVLVVDDDEGLAQVVAFALRAAGFDVATARDGVDGYVAYIRHHADWVVTDIQMPQLDGLGMMQCIRAINPRVKTVYVSGAVEQYRAGLQSENEQFGARVLSKPFSCDTLIGQLMSGSVTVQSPTKSPVDGGRQESKEV